MEATFETQAISILGTLALVLMVVVTGGVVYLTAVDWRDRRRRKRDQQATKRGKSKKK
jgi:heme/copper-type cytochrome/quinol oxidase subunit 2